MRASKTSGLAISYFVLLSVLWPSIGQAHRSGCHNLHTCPSDTTSYVCGDLGYPCDGATSVTQIAPGKIHVPLVIEKAFVDAFGRPPTDAESKYWKTRFRADKDGLYKLRRTMAWHQANESFGPKPANKHQVIDIPALFRAVYDGQSPTASEHTYWRMRLKDKPTAEALAGAMAYHKMHKIGH